MKDDIILEKQTLIKQYCPAVYAIAIYAMAVLVCYPGNITAAVNEYEAGFHQRTNVFSRVYDTQHQSSFHAGVDHSSGKYLLRIRRGVRFNQTAYQWELESYPVLSEQIYAYLAYAYSDSRIYPHHRAGAELFAALPARSEGSLGMRYFDFQTGSESVIATVSLSHYFQAYMATIRPYFVFSDNKTGQTWMGSIRRYFNDEGDYLLIRAATGRSSDQVLFQVGQTMEKSFLLLKSTQIGLEGRFKITERISGLAGLGLYRQELSFDPGTYVNNWSFRYGLNVHF